MWRLCTEMHGAKCIRSKIASLSIFVVFLFFLPKAEAATIVGGSDLLTASYATQVESWLVTDPQLSYSGPLQFTNIFDKGAGDNSVSFHTAADGQGPTVVVMQATGPSGGTQIIGGFNPQSWKSSGDYNTTPILADRIAFIFNLSTTDRRDQSVVDTYYGPLQTFNRSSDGPTFGGGYDIFVNSSLSLGYLNSDTYCANPSSTCRGGLNLLGLSYGGSTYEVHFGQIEVFTIAETAPAPPALPLFTSGLGVLGFLGWRRKRKAGACAA